MLVPVACGLVLGLGLWCLLRAFLVPTTPLDRALAALGQPRRSGSGTELGGGAGGGVGAVDDLAGRFGAWIMAVTGTDLRGLAPDLAVLERSQEHHLVQRMRTALLYGAFPLMVWAFTRLGAGIDPAHPALILVAALGAGVVGWFVTDAQVRGRARARRREFDGALVTYVSLVAVLLAGGAGIQQALTDAVDTGRGWAFLVLRRALTDARIRGVSPWEAFDEHGTRLGLTSLVDLAATMELGGTSGAHVRESLITKAKALRTHQLAALEREAAGRTSAMVGPTGLMLAGFVILLIYPAFQAILNL